MYQRDSAALAFRQPGERLGDPSSDITVLETLIRRPPATGRVQRLNWHGRAAGPNIIDAQIVGNLV
jgi:hypothetical protein